MVQKTEEVTDMKKKKGLLLLLLLLAVLLAAYFGLRSFNGKQEEKGKAEEEASKAAVTQTDPEEITAITYDVGNGEMSFVREDGTWYVSDDKDFPLTQSYPEDMASDVGQITADRRLEDGDALSDYGLDEPVYTVEYTDSAGETTSVHFGNMTGDQYYVNVGDSDTVYTVDSTVIDSLNYTLADMAELDDYPSIGSGNLKKEVITEKGKTTTYDSEDEDQAEDIAAVAGGLGAVTLSEAADYSVEDKDLAAFGLDEDSRITVEATYTKDEEEQVLTLYIGGEDGDGNRYVMVNESRIVYLISNEICENILNV